MIHGMPSDLTLRTPDRELCSRTGDGIQVQLLWSPATDRVHVTVIDSRFARGYDFEVDGKDAMQAFQHPFAHLDTLGDDRVRLLRSPCAAGEVSQ
jgi:hypothetical protein